ncbi:hypothetical protein D3C72_1859430 [compost metagenome]
MKPPHELLDLELLRADAVHGRDEPLQDVIAAPVLLGALHGHQVLGLRDDADGARIAGRIRAKLARIHGAQVRALAAELDLLLGVGECLRQPLHVRRGLLEEVVSKALGALGSDAGELLQLLDELREGFRVEQPRLFLSGA